MTTPRSFVHIAGQFEGSPSDIQSHVQASEWLDCALSSSPVQEQQGLQFQNGPGQYPSHSSLHIPNNHYPDPHFPDTTVYSTPVDQVDSDPVSAEDYLLASFESDLSRFSNYPDPAFTSLNLTQDDTPWTTSDPQYGQSPPLAQDFAMNDIPQTSGEVAEYSIPPTFVASPTSYAINLDPRLSTSSQDTGASFQTTDPYGFSSVDIPPPDWGSGQQVARLLVENSSTRNLAGPAAGAHSSFDSYPGESQPVYDEAVQLVPNRYCAARPPFEQQSMPFERPVGRCQWEDENGTICEEEVTYGGLPEHLFKHGIKQKSRNHPTKCNWVCCKKKRPMNRESILRHIREVHLGLKRPAKRVQSASGVLV